jgi:transposase
MLNLKKNDDRDAEGIAEAASRPTMRFVELKSQDQLDMQSLHRVRDRLISQRTSLMNQIRALLLERGYIMPQGKAKLAKRLTELLEEGASDLSPRIVSLIKDMRDQWLSLDQRITSFDDEFTQQAHSDDGTRRLLSIPGIGALNAHCSGCLDWRCRHICSGSRLGGLAGTCAKAGHPRWQAATCWHNKTGRQIFTKNAGLGSPISVSNVKQKSDSIGRMVAWSFIARSHE